MKKVFLLSLFLMGCAHGSFLPAVMTMKRAEPTEPVELVFDKQNDTAQPRLLRKNENIKASASASFSEKSARVIARLSQVVTVFDLGQESHGLINDKPVTWQADRNWAAANLGRDEAVAREKRLLADLHIGSKIGKVRVKSIETEESLIRSLGQNYVRLAVTEHLRPTDGDVDFFVETVRDLPPESWIHFHSREGTGRATVFMIMLDMLHNAELTSYDAIVTRNLALNKDPDLLAVPDDEDWRKPYQQDLVRFLAEFYKYAKAYPMGQKSIWTQRGSL